MEINSSARMVHDADVNQHDVLIGTSTPRNIVPNPGNVNFKNLIHRYHNIYSASPKDIKGKISRDLVRVIRNTGGRFLAWNPTSANPILDEVGDPIEMWKELNFTKSYVKICSAMKHRTYAVRRRCKVTQRDMGMFAFSRALILPQFESLLDVQRKALDPQFRLQTRPRPVHRPEFDVYTKGKGFKSNTCTGNQLFVGLTKANGIEFQQAPNRARRKDIAASIYFAIKHFSGGKFLRRQDNVWIEQTEKVSLAKIAQALRDCQKYDRQCQQLPDDSPNTVPACRLASDQTVPPKDPPVTAMDSLVDNLEFLEDTESFIQNTPALSDFDFIGIGPGCCTESDGTAQGTNLLVDLKELQDDNYSFLETDVDLDTILQDKDFGLDIQG